ncbi:hypothetical protein ACOMHN_035241 [Nucella lapillus]
MMIFAVGGPINTLIGVDWGVRELETVRKGTPLYGQPDWWGDDSSPKGNHILRLPTGTLGTNYSTSTEKRSTDHSPSPGKQDRDHSPSPGKQDRDHSPSPGKQDRDHSPSPGKQDRDHSPSPGKQDRDHSPSPGKQDRDHSPSPGKQDRDPSPSPGKQDRDHSPSPGKLGTERYPSPRTRDRVHSPSSAHNSSQPVLYQSEHLHGPQHQHQHLHLHLDQHQDQHQRQHEHDQHGPSVTPVQLCSPLPVPATAGPGPPGSTDLDRASPCPPSPPCPSRGRLSVLTPAAQASVSAADSTSSTARDSSSSSFALTPAQPPPSAAEKPKVGSHEGSRSSGDVGSLEMNSSPALTFTVEFGDSRKRPLKSGVSLSEFVPPRLLSSLLSARARLDTSLAAKSKQSAGSGASKAGRVTSGARADPLPSGDSNTEKTMLHNGQAARVTSISKLDGCANPQHISVKQGEGSLAVPHVPSADRGPGVVTHRRSRSSKPPLQKQKSLGRTLGTASRASPTDVTAETEETAGGTDFNLPPDPSPSVDNDNDNNADNDKDDNDNSASADNGHNDSGQNDNANNNDSKSAINNKADNDIADNNDNDSADKVSDAGTYTIEGEEGGEEERTARQQIDEVFGVHVSNLAFQRPVIDSWQESSAPCAARGERSGCEGNEWGWQSSREVGKDRSALADSAKRRGVTGWEVRDDVAPWISQLTALTSSPRRSSSSSSSTPTHRDDVTDEGNRKPPQGAAHRRRPGTGRRLPSLPSDASSAGSERSFRLRDVISPHSTISTLNGSPTPTITTPTPLTTHPDVHDSGQGVDSPVNGGRSGSLGSQSGRSGSLGSQSVRSGPLGSQNGRSGSQGVRLSRVRSREDGDGGVLRRPLLKVASATTRASLDSQLLLRTTNSVMEAMEITMGFSRKETEVTRSDTRTVTVTSGEADGGGPGGDVSETLTPAGRRSGKVQVSARCTVTSVSSRQASSLTASDLKPAVTTAIPTRTRSGAAAAAGMLTRHGSLDLDPGLGDCEGHCRPPDRVGPAPTSAGKGVLTVAKPNRAFQLRRARADSTETRDSERGRASQARSRAQPRASSLHATPRAALSQYKAPDPAGTKDGRSRGKSATRERTSAPRARDRSLPRADGAPHAPLQSRRALTSASVSSTIASRAKEKEREALMPRGQARSDQKELSLTGLPRGSHSQPNSRSNSPKSAERLAWKRRKEYDPRRAVAEAKAGRSKESRVKAKAPSSGETQQRLTRSVSLTNTADLTLTALTAGHPPTAHCPPSKGDNSAQRAFLPFHSPRRVGRFSGSADEEEGRFSPRSQDSNPSPHRSPTPLCRPSAFTPPLPKPPSASPDPACLARRMVLVDVPYDDMPLAGDTADSARETYNALMVSSLSQLSDKLRKAADRTTGRLREQSRLAAAPSPRDDVWLEEQTRGEFPAWRSANQELATVLRNMRGLEHHLHLVDQVLFPEGDSGADVGSLCGADTARHLQEIHRRRARLAAFHPIATPPLGPAHLSEPLEPSRPTEPSEHSEPTSPEMAQLSQLLF